MMYKKVIHTHRLFNCVILDLRMVKNSNLISIWLAFLKCVGWTKTSAVIYLSTTWYINTCWYKWLVIYYELIMVILTFTNLLLNFLVRLYDMTSCFILGWNFLSHNITIQNWPLNKKRKLFTFKKCYLLTMKSPFLLTWK